MKLAPALPAGGDLPKVPAVGDVAPKLPLPVPDLPAVPGLPAVGSLPVPKLPLPDTAALPLPLPLPGVPSLDEADALDKVVKLGSTVLEVILDILSKGTSLFSLPGGVGLPPTSSLPIPNASVPLQKRQLGALLGGVAPQASPVAGAAGTVTNALGGGM